MIAPLLILAAPNEGARYLCHRINPGWRQCFPAGTPQRRIDAYICSVSPEHNIKLCVKPKRANHSKEPINEQR
jgi:hypothetical protein